MIGGLSLFSCQKSVVPLVCLALQRYSFFMKWQKKMEKKDFVRGRTPAAIGGEDMKKPRQAHVCRGII